ncbi:hypothetical protein ACWGH8_34885 [Nonomuraea muscovyensis]
MVSRLSTRSGRWRSRQDESHGMRLAIGDLARAAAAPGWSRLTVHHAQVGSHGLTTVVRDGHEIGAEGLDEPFRRLRELSYQGGAGTWFSCELAFSPGTRGYACRVDSAAAPFDDVPAPAALAELTAFPRDEPPGWLLAALPTAAPIGLPTTYGERYDWLWKHTGERPPPSPAISGESAYLPATTMTARAFAHGQKHGRHLVQLAGQADEPEAEQFMVMCSGESYHVGRRSVRGTGGGTGRDFGIDAGLRSITLDGATLRLDLTPEAADTLETETSFEIRLDLDPGSLGDLRAVLPGMLRSVVRAPRLIGF